MGIRRVDKTNLLSTIYRRVRRLQKTRKVTIVFRLSSERCLVKDYDISRRVSGFLSSLFTSRLTVVNFFVLFVFSFSFDLLRCRFLVSEGGFILSGIALARATQTNSSSHVSWSVDRQKKSHKDSHYTAVVHSWRLVSVWSIFLRQLKTSWNRFCRKRGVERKGVSQNVILALTSCRHLPPQKQKTISISFIDCKTGFNHTSKC